MNLISVFFVLVSMFNFHFGLEQSYNKVGYTQKGTASYYAEAFHGRKTANGELFDMNAMTAAHPRIMFNTLLQVTNLNNGKSVVVRINDRGPYVGGRILDVSRAAAQKLGMDKDGTTRVQIEVIKVQAIPEPLDKDKAKEEQDKAKDKEPLNRTKLLEKIRQKLGLPDKDNKEKPADKQQGSGKDHSRNDKKDTPVTDNQGDKTPPVGNKDKKPLGKPKLEEAVTRKPKPLPDTNEERPPAEVKPDENKFKAMNTYSVWGTEKLPEGFGVQIGSYSDLQKAIDIAKTAINKGFEDVFLQVGWNSSNTAKVYRVLVGDGTADKARELITQLRDKGYSGVFVKQHY